MTSLAALLQKYRDDARGNLALMSALLLIPLMICVGAAVDFAHAYNVRSKLQSALDAALLSAAKSTDESGRLELANSTFALNTSDLGHYQPRATFNLSLSSEISGAVTATVSTSFMQLGNVEAIPVAVQSKVAMKGTSSKVCVLLMDPSADSSLRMNSGANVTAPDCEIHVRSNANQAANFNAGITIDVKRICIKGPGTLNNYGPISSLEVNCDAVDDPYAGILPTPSSSSCTYSNLNFNGGSVTLNPGVYCGWANFNSAPTVHFNPGVYVIKNGGWNVNGGTWTGSGVTFYFADTSMIQFNSGVSATMTPPTSGTYKGLFMYEATGLSKSNFVLDDSKDFDVEGLIHLPSRNTTFNSGSQIYSHSFTLVVNTLILNQTKWDLSPDETAISASGSGGGGSSTYYLSQ